MALSFNLDALIISHFILISLLFFLPNANSLNFSFTNFKNSQANIDYSNDSYYTPNGEIQLTANQQDASSTMSAGRASYNKPVRLWDVTTRELASFTTQFSFRITPPTGDINKPGDGMTFFLAGPFNSSVSAPQNASGACLGLVSGTNCNITSAGTQFVAVEFDTYPNPIIDEPIRSSHVAIDVNTVYLANSTTYGTSPGILNSSMPCNATITYDSSKLNLSVFVTFVDYLPISFSSTIDLRESLPDRVRVGFTASTGSNFEIHNVLFWEFNSTLSDDETSSGTTQPEPTSNDNETPSGTTQPEPTSIGSKKSDKKVGLIAGVLTGVIVLSIGLSLVAFMWLRRRPSHENDHIDSDLSDDFESGTGPKRFTYNELSRATNNYAEERKLGQGGFGGVYLGLLKDPNTEIAVKKVSQDSRQGKKEYVSEVKIISRLRHRNLVQLLGWCHEQGNLLLVYELLPNGSLDSHLYGSIKDALPWTVRHKISIDLASALVYLHEDWDQCVLHRDIKSSNIMLDSNFNAKLGDFGLARLVDHSLGSQTTVLAGTLGYLAPECAITGRASKESDVFSFGVVALEIASGRRAIEPKEELSKVRNIDWVWNLYGKGLLMEAIDKRLEGKFDANEIECLMTVGLWCCHPDSNIRPSASQVLKVLKSEAPLPILPLTYPIPSYASIPLGMGTYSIACSSEFTGSSGATSSSSQSILHGTAPLLFERSY